MALELLGNSYLTTLSGSITAGAGVCTVHDALPSNLIAGNAGGQFRVQIDSEIIIVTGTSGTGNTSWSLVRGAEGTTAASHANNTTVLAVVTSEALASLTDRTPGGKPDDAGLLLATADPALASDSFRPGVGFIYVAKFWVPATVTMTNLVTYVRTTGSGLGSVNVAGVYDSSGSLVAQTADQTSAWGSVGAKTMALTAQPGHSLTLIGGAGVFYWVGFLSTISTPASFAAIPGGIPNLGFGVPYTSTVPGARHRLGFESAGSRGSLISLNGLSLSDQFAVKIPLFGVT